MPHSSALKSIPKRTIVVGAKNRAVFLDRDGTIILDGKYISDPAQVELLPNAKEALSILRSAGYMLFLFTNQSGVGRGYFPLEAVYRCNQRMLELLDLGPSLFADICIAPESPDQPAIYRKPNPRFINESIAKYGIDPTNAWMAGDKGIDVETGINAGISGVQIGKNYPVAYPDMPNYDSLLKFAQAITCPAK